MRKLVSLELDTDVIEKIKLIAKQQDRSVSSLIRVVLAEFISNNENKEE